MENKLESLSDIGNVDEFIFDKNDIEEWIDNFLSVPHKAFADMPPCPYAKKAWMDKKVQVEISTSRDLDDDIKKTLANFPVDKDIIVFLLDPREISPEGLEVVSKTYSTDKWLLMEDHPEGYEEVHDLCLNNGKYAIIFCNRREILENAREELKKTHYYDKFDPEYKEEVWSR
jgi:hypothetical protein